MRIPTLLMLLLSLATTAPALAQETPEAPAPAPAPARLPAVSGEEARQTLDILRDDARRAALIGALETIARAQGVAVPPASSPAPAAPPPAAAPTQAQAAKPAAPAPAPKDEADDKESPIPLAPDSVGAQVLAAVSDFTAKVAADAAAALRTVRSIPSLWGWLQTMATDPMAHRTLWEVAWRLSAVLAVALALEWLIRLVLRRPFRALERLSPAQKPGVEVEPEPPPEIADSGLARAETGESEPPIQPATSAATLLQRLPLVLARLLLECLPLLAFTIAGHMLIDSAVGGTRLIRLILLSVVDAYIVCRAAFLAVRALISPESPRLRLLRVSNQAARYVMRWTVRVVSVVVFGYAGGQVGLLLGMTIVAHSAFLKGIGFLAAIMLAVIVLQKRKPIARWIAGDPHATGTVGGFRRRTARVWHIIAMFYLAALWLVWAVELRNGVSEVLNIFVLTVAVGVCARLLLILLQGSLDRALQVTPAALDRYPGLEERAKLYQRFLSAALAAAVSVLAALILLQLWGLRALSWVFGTILGRNVLSAVTTILLTFLLALFVWEVANSAVQRHLAKLSKDGQVARSARLRTLLPLLKTALLVFIATVVILTTLSEIGLNIAPLLAGAGIIGVAIGFGSQKLVQDLITGIFLLLENAMQVGDFVTVSGLSGTVEALSVRTIRLRAGDGSVHIIPFSAVTSVTNTNRGLGNAAVSVTVALDEDTDRIGELLSEIAAGMRGEAAFADLMLSDLQLWGVDKVDPTSVTLAGQIVCTDTGRWAVQREFNRRVTRRFQELGIRMPTPVQDLVIRRSPWDAAFQQLRPVQPPRLQEGPPA